MLVVQVWSTCTTDAVQTSYTVISRVVAFFSLVIIRQMLLISIFLRCSGKQHLMSPPWWREPSINWTQSMKTSNTDYFSMEGVKLQRGIELMISNSVPSLVCAALFVHQMQLFWYRTAVFVSWIQIYFHTEFDGKERCLQFWCSDVGDIVCSSAKWQHLSEQRRKKFSSLSTNTHATVDSCPKIVSILECYRFVISVSHVPCVEHPIYHKNSQQLEATLSLFWISRDVVLDMLDARVNRWAHQSQLNDCW